MNYQTESRIRQAIRNGNGRELAEAIAGDVFATYDDLEQVFEDEPGGWLYQRPFGRIEMGCTTVHDRFGRPEVEESGL